LETVPNRVAVPGVALHPSGALVYEPYLDGPAPPATGIHGGFRPTEENGRRLLANHERRTIFELATVPVGIGARVSFHWFSRWWIERDRAWKRLPGRCQSHTRRQSAVATLKDMNTLILTTPAMSPGPQQLVLSNPDGESVSLDAVFVAQ
jgi:hypothetical protein